MDDLTQKLIKDAGFKLFKDSIVAADNTVSGDATHASQQLVRLVVLECINIAMHYTKVDDAVPVIKLHFNITE